MKYRFVHIFKRTKVPVNFVTEASDPEEALNNYARRYNLAKQRYWEYRESTQRLVRTDYVGNFVELVYAEPVGTDSTQQEQV